ncbi:uncharacterized protein LOC132698534 [Cylas formicarius]|uniref:uncharacterized protein LOC132698534 n=1 Tax=Cylas formicarius TaxID=197179 RepID=UPI0029589432|nr:uncharacterized protein LOC132698534 [Cylas formicarius]
MSGVVFIIIVPTEDHEKVLLRKLKKKVKIEENPEIILSQKFSTEGLEYSTESNREKCKQHLPKHKTDQSMENTIRLLLKELEIIHSVWTQTEDGNYYQVIFSIENEKCEDILENLRDSDIGKKLQSKVSVIPCTIHYKGSEYKVTANASKSDEEILEEKETEGTNTGWNFFISSVRSRLTVAQVVENVKVRAAMTFDFIVLLLISTTLCALGLVEDSKIYMLSSMLISPMMGPVMAGTFGSVVQDKHLQKIGVQNELIGLGIATIVGFCYGSLICLVTDKYGYHDWPTYEMYSRGELRSLWVGALIALLSGAAVALGVLSDNIASLVGVAISTSLMPPTVNAGLLWSLGFVYYVKGNDTTRFASLTRTNYYSSNTALELVGLGAISICLTFVNIICIYAAGILVFKIKEVAPHTTRDHARRRFWKHDIKVARNYNKTVQYGDKNDSFQTISDQIAHYHRTKDSFHHSTDLSKENLKVKIKRSEYTWSPCVNNVYDQYESLVNVRGCSSNAVKCHFPVASTRGHRRLSQIFPRCSPKDEFRRDKQDIEKQGLVSAVVDPVSTCELVCSNKKFTVTPCDLEQLKGVV